MHSDTDTNVTRLRLLIDDTNVGESSVSASRYDPLGISGIKASVTGGTSYTAKLQMAVVSGTGNFNADTRTCSLILIAFPK